MLRVCALMPSIDAIALKLQESSPKENVLPRSCKNRSAIAKHARRGGCFCELKATKGSASPKYRCLWIQPNSVRAKLLFDPGIGKRKRDEEDKAALKKIKSKTSNGESKSSLTSLPAPPLTKSNSSEASTKAGTACPRLKSPPPPPPQASATVPKASNTSSKGRQATLDGMLLLLKHPPGIEKKCIECGKLGTHGICRSCQRPMHTGKCYKGHVCPKAMDGGSTGDLEPESGENGVGDNDDGEDEDEEDEDEEDEEEEDEEEEDEEEDDEEEGSRSTAKPKAKTRKKGVGTPKPAQAKARENSKRGKKAKEVVDKGAQKKRDEAREYLANMQRRRQARPSYAEVDSSDDDFEESEEDEEEESDESEEGDSDSVSSTEYMDMPLSQEQKGKKKAGAEDAEEEVDPAAYDNKKHKIILPPSAHKNPSIRERQINEGKVWVWWVCGGLGG